jgi:hypothetical protein
MVGKSAARAPNEKLRHNTKIPVRVNMRTTSRKKSLRRADPTARGKEDMKGITLE